MTIIFRETVSQEVLKKGLGIRITSRVPDRGEMS